MILIGEIYFQMTSCGEMILCVQWFWFFDVSNLQWTDAKYLLIYGVTVC